MNEHRHEAKCWIRYEGCGEHHGHTYDCGGGVLSPSCPLYEWDLRMQLMAEMRRACSYLACAYDLAMKLCVANPHPENRELRDLILQLVTVHKIRDKSKGYNVRMK